MPEIAVYKNRKLVASYDKVWAAWESANIPLEGHI